jgi:hypothetical protein
MKAIIKGKRYDTEKAAEVADEWNGHAKESAKYLRETIYLTKSGNWFLHGAGGSSTKYAVEYGHFGRSGQKLIPLSVTEAKQWLEEHNKVEAVEEHFGSSITDA